MVTLELEFLNFAITVALAVISIFVSSFALLLARAEAKRADEIHKIVMRDLRVVSVRAERTERNTERVFDQTMHALIAAAKGGARHATADVASGSAMSKLVQQAIPPDAPISEKDRGRLAQAVTKQIAQSMATNTLKSTSIMTGLSPDVQKILSGSDNPPIAERYVELVRKHPGMLSEESVRSTNYEDYERVLDYLLRHDILQVRDGRLELGGAFP